MRGEFTTYSPLAAMYASACACRVGRKSKYSDRVRTSKSTRRGSSDEQQALLQDLPAQGEPDLVQDDEVHLGDTERVCQIHGQP